MYGRAALVLALCLAASAPARAQDRLPGRAPDASAGEDVFIKCSGCHQVGPGAENSIGPSLNGVVGSVAGAVEGYDYSTALKDAKPRWTHDALAAFVVDAKGTVPGTKMSFAGLKSRQDVDDVIAYLAQFDREGRTKP